MAKMPSLQFYPGDWLRDDVSACSLAAQGLWLRMMIVAHDSANYGFLEVNGLPMPREMIARKCGCGIEEFDGLMAELDSAGVPSRAANGAIYSRRMVRDGAQRKQKSKKRSEAGRAGAEARWQTDGKPMANAMANGMAKNGSSSSSSSSSSKESLSLAKASKNESGFFTGLTDSSEFSDQFQRFWKATPKHLMASIDACWLAWEPAVVEAAGLGSIDEEVAAEWLVSRWREYLASPKGKGKSAFGPKAFLADGRWKDACESWNRKPSETPANSQVPEKAMPKTLDKSKRAAS